MCDIFDKTLQHNQTEKKMDHIFFNLFELDPETEEDSIFMGVLNMEWTPYLFWCTKTYVA